MSTGRPSIYSQEIADSICQGIMDGLGLRTICEAEGMPACSTVFNWLQSNKSFMEQYARAREIQAEVMADEITSISDETPLMTIPTKHGDTYDAVDPAGVNRNRLRVDSRKWIASKLLPKKYGDKVAHTGEDGGPIVFKLERIGQDVTKE